MRAKTRYRGETDQRRHPLRRVRSPSARARYRIPFPRTKYLDEVQKIYGNKVKLVVRDFPLTRHANARKAAEAANAANAQGKFFEYAALLFKRQDALDVASLKKYASELGLDRARFDAALDGGKFAAEVKHDMDDGDIYGVDSTPAIFVNGMALTEMSMEALRALIDKGLAAANTPPKISGN